MHTPANNRRLPLDTWVQQADTYCLNTYKVSINDMMAYIMIQDLYNNGLNPDEAIDYHLHTFAIAGIEYNNINIPTEAELEAKYGSV